MKNGVKFSDLSEVKSEKTSHGDSEDCSGAAFGWADGKIGNF